METNIQKTIRERYKKLIDLISQIGNSFKIVNEFPRSISIKVLDGKDKEMLYFELTAPYYNYADKKNYLRVCWTTSSNVCNKVGEEYFNENQEQSTIFLTLLFRISIWKLQTADYKVVKTLDDILGTNLAKEWTKDRYAANGKQQINKARLLEYKNKSAKVIKRNNIFLFIGFIIYISIIFALGISIFNLDYVSYCAICLTIFPVVTYFLRIYYKGLKFMETNEIPDEDVFIDNWSLIDFAKEFGKMRIAPFVNKETGEEFKTCIFINSKGEKIWVRFSDELGVLSSTEITQRKDELKVGLKMNGYYYLHNENVVFGEYINLND